MAGKGISTYSDLYSFNTPFEKPMRSGLGELHWRFGCEAECRKCGKKVGQIWACPRVRWGASEKAPIKIVKPNEEQIMTGIALLVHNNHVGRDASHKLGCPVAAMPRGKHLLAGVTTNGSQVRGN